MPSPTYICPPCRQLLLTSVLKPTTTTTTPRPLHKRFTHTHLPAPSPPPLHSGLINLSLPLSPTTATAQPPPRALLSLHGPDASKFLQAVTTIDIPPLTTTSPASAYSGFLNAQGRLLWEGFVYNVNGSKAWRERGGEVSIGAGGLRGKWGVDDPCWFVETSGAGAEGLRRWLGRYVLRSKVSITPVPTVGQAGGVGWDVWAAWGAGEKSLSGVGNFESIPTANDNRAPGLFTRYLLPARPSSDFPEGSGGGATLSDYHLRRYLHGIAESPPEVTPPERSLPHEYNLDLYPPPHGLSFHKGCYVGQELTVRTQHRGVVRKRVIPVQLSSLSPPIPAHHGGIVYDPTSQLELPPPGEAEIVSCHSQVHEGGGGGRARSAGRFIAGVGNVGIALVRLESVFGQGWEGEVGTREGGRWGGEGFKVVWEEEMGGGEGGEVEGGLRRREVNVRAWMPGWHFRGVLPAGEGGR